MTLLQQDIDWSHLLQTALGHGTMPLLYKHLNTICPEAIPKSAMEQLKNHFHMNAGRNLFLTRELLKLLDLFEVHGIPAIPYKGPILAASVYGDVSLRQFNDLDLLIHKCDVLKVKDLLISQGYEPTFQLTRAQEKALLQSKCEYSFNRYEDRVHVEVHWQIVPTYFAFPLDFEYLWERLELPVSLVGKTTYSIPPEDLILILCVHGFSHLWAFWGWICDVAELIRTYQGLDWKRVMKQADKLGGERMLFLGLLLAADLLGAVIPKEIMQRIGTDPTVESLAIQARKRLFHKIDAPLNIFERCILYLKGREHLQDRIQFCFRMAMILTNFQY